MLCSKASSKEGHVVIMMDPHCSRMDPPSVTSPMCVYTCTFAGCCSLCVLFWLIIKQSCPKRREKTGIRTKEHVSETCRYIVRRPWHLLNVDALRAGLSASRLCQPDSWIDCSIDQLAELYTSELTSLLDQLIPAKTVTIRRRPSDPWFDQECRETKRAVRRLENLARLRCTPEATTAWYSERREYRALLQWKREQFWQKKIDSEKSTPRQLWRSIDALLGRGRVPPLGDILR